MNRYLASLVVVLAAAVAARAQDWEPIFNGNRMLGYVSSANYGYSVRQSIAYGYLPIEYANEGAKVDIYFFGDRYAATVTKEPLFDPENVRLKA